MLRTGAIICAAFGIDTDLTLIYQLFALLLCLLLVSRAALFLQKPRVSVKRHLPRYATAGEPFEYLIEVRNEGDAVETDLTLIDNPRVTAPSAIEYRNLREPGEETRNRWDRFIGYHRFMWLQRRNTGIIVKQQALPDIHLKSRVNVHMDALPLRRGYVRFRSSSVLHPDPFGLSFGIQEFDNAEQLLVLPKRYRIASGFEIPGGRHFQPGGVNSTWSIGESDEFVSLREYRDGDTLRKIHWPSTARRGKPIVREYQDEYFVRQALVLDTSTNNQPVFEEAVSVAASFALRLAGHESIVDLVYMTDKPEFVTSGQGADNVNRQLEVLACVGRNETPISLLADTLVFKAKRLSGCILILCGWDEQRMEMVDRLHRSRLALEVFVITKDRTASNIPPFVHVLSAGNVQEGLLKL